ncbi:MAG TPA: hypothetical protein PKE51_12760 [Gemmatimonadaceae bacterium]|nr:hypothetical protein [Gemmatimonadaceae bacterium]
MTAQARVVGLHRGREVDAVMRLRLEEAGLAFADESRGHRFRVPLESIDGWQEASGHVSLYLHGGDVLDVEVREDDARALLRQVLDAAASPPEFARSLRALGSAEPAEQAAHDRWFGPLLQARRDMQGVSDPLRQAALCDADTLAAEMTRTLAELAAQRTGGDGPRTRALEAMLEDETIAVREALARLALTASMLQGSAADSRLADWREWLDAVRALFVAMDAAWPAIARTLRDGV